MCSGSSATKDDRAAAVIAWIIDNNAPSERTAATVPLAERGTDATPVVLAFSDTKQSPQSIAFTYCVYAEHAAGGPHDGLKHCQAI